MPKGGRGRGRAKGKGRAQLLADGESLRPARRPALDKDDEASRSTQDRVTEEKSARKTSSHKDLVTESTAGTSSPG